MQDINNKLAALLEAVTNFFEASLANIENLLADIKTNTPSNKRRMYYV